MTRIRLVLLLLAAVVTGFFLARLLPRSSNVQSTSVDPSATPRPGQAAAPDLAPTRLYAHNLMLRKGPDFRVYVRWIDGTMVRTRKGVNPSFDDPDSFVLEIEQGVIRANIGDVSNFLNAASPPGSPLQHISLQPDGDLLKLRGTVHKFISLPVEITGRLSPAANGLVRFSVTKLNVLRIPFKGLLGGFHIQLADLVQAGNLPGIQIAGNDILFDTQKLLPPPHIHGAITAVRVQVPDIEVVYGKADVDETRLAQWHNFLRLSGGSLDFGKLTMHHVDLTMIDAASEPWFDLDLVNYQAQLVNGYTRMTPQAGLEIFMPDVDENASKKKAYQGITLEWLKNRNTTLPPGVPLK